MRPAWVVVAGLAPAVGGCALPDLVAHTVKKVEQRQSAPASSSSATAEPAAAVSSPAATPARVEDSAPPLATSPPARRPGAITSEELPPAR